jgi:hypothetical protein
MVIKKLVTLSLSKGKFLYVLRQVCLHCIAAGKFRMTIVVLNTILRQAQDDKKIDRLRMTNARQAQDDRLLY